MTLETQTKISSTPTPDGYRVTVTEVQKGNPMLLGFYSILTSRDGTQRRIGQVVRVPDNNLRQRLHAEVRPGNEIRVFI